MKSITLRTAPVALALLAVSGAVVAEMTGKEFSAESYQKGPQGEQQGRIFVGKDRVRTEMTHQGQQVIQIVDNQKKVQWVVFPAQKNYMEQNAAATLPMQSPAANQNPCEGMAGATCRNLGPDTVTGRKVTKWEMTLQQQGQTQKMVQWLDTERGMPLRMEADGGLKMDLKMVGKENLSGRAVEKWERTTTQPNQQPSVSTQWYDPELQLTVREELPGGFVREMRNIKVGVQPAELFTLPAGFQKVTPPPPQQGQGQAPTGGMQGGQPAPQR